MKPESKSRAAAGRIAAAAAVICGLALAGAAPLPKVWQNWKYSRAILAPPASEPRLVVVAIPFEVLQHAQGSLADLRVMDGAGSQVPFILRLPPGAPLEITRAATLRDNTFVKGAYSQVVMDLGPNATYHNTLLFGTSGPEYVVSAEIATSNNQQDWQDVATGDKLFRFEDPSREWEEAIHYPESNARYVRLRILSPDAPFQVLHPQIEFREAPPEEAAPVPVEFAPDSDSPAGHTRWSLDLGSEGAPAIAVGFQTTEPEFRRSVSICYGAEPNPQYGSTGEVYRLARNGQTYERLSLPVHAYDSGDRHWQVDVFNGDDRPLAALQPALYIAPRRVVFWQEPGKSYSLLYGQFRAPRPVYDLAARTDVKQLAAAVPAGLGPEDGNTAYVPPVPWTERHTWLMWAALALALLLLGFTAVRTLSRIPQSKD